MNDTISRSNCDLFMNYTLDLIVTFYDLLWMTLSRSNCDLLWMTLSRSNCDLCDLLWTTLSRSNCDLLWTTLSRFNCDLLWPFMNDTI